MEAERLRDLLRSFFEGTIDRKDYNSLFRYLAGILKKKGASGLDYGEVGEIVRDFMIKLLENRDKLLSMMDNPAGLKAYIGTALKNFLIDHLRKKKKKIHEILEADLRSEDNRESLVEKSRFVKNYELTEIEEVFKKEVKPENVKYFCYLLDSKRYKCLWGNKSMDAIYQDVSRKKRIVEEFGRRLKELKVSEELVREFINTRLSEICEDLRSKLCEEEKE